MNIDDSKRICIITNAFTEHSVASQVSDLVTIVSSNNNVLLITGKFFNIRDPKVEIITTPYKSSFDQTAPAIFLRFLLSNVHISSEAFRHRTRFNTVIFYSSNYLLPMIILKKLKKNIIVIVLGETQHCAKFWYKDRLFGFGSHLATSIFKLLKNASFTLADKIVLEYQRQSQEPEFTNFLHKIEISQIRYINDNFLIQNQKKKDKTNGYFCVGYIGRFSAEKGIINLIESIPSIISIIPKTKFIIVGGGEIEDVLEERVNTLNLDEVISFPGWIPHEELPTFIGKMDLLVIPSYTEGLPGVLIEALASGTPILANDVGAVSEIIEDSETGFIMKDNSPDTIAKNAIRALQYQEIDKIKYNGINLVQQKFTKTEVCNKWNKILGAYD